MYRIRARALSEEEQFYNTGFDLDGFTLQHVIDQTEVLCLAAVRWQGLTLEYVKNQEEICLVARLKQQRDVFFVTIM